MKGVRHLVGIPFALLACGISVALTLFFTASPEPPHVPPPPPAPPPALADISCSIETIALDPRSGKSFARVRLTRDEVGAPADRVWVTVSFLTADGPPGGARACEPVELREPFGAFDSATVTVTATCDWLVGRSAPSSGYYARVYASTLSARDALNRARQDDFDVASATPVLIQNADRRGGTR
jgi:hypothetical protein